ncbi:hypothetical protein FBY35_0016 [Streptomyces sp. SLBN-118]|uniref:hypothetical protein n=1 Tax=Streptomyces sp. SLBN-118 TaxID=2768454 RepID=UPI001150D68A|nr:hypothetical protein [Streptomyces sp. SLBN-118]TQK42305.1 hypothetical protein FBY35_3684 [Streptomyces sp. SLBN-118]TQK49754.1 hypothetical protein FBY35_0016 [Streptomyces sp. SLBN-118]
MSAAAAGRVGRFYTSARRHPWVLGKVADWKIPLGPYTPAQIAVAVGGGFLLVKTISWWSWMGPVPIAAWLLAIWAVRRPKIRGRAPMQAALGWVLLGWQPRGGRIGGRAARDRAPRPLLGGFTIEDALTPTTAATPAHAARRPADRTPRQSPAPVPSSARHRTQTAAPAAPVQPVSGMQQLLALAERGGGVR